MNNFLTIIGGVLLVFGFWTLLNAFDKTGQERSYRIRVAIGSMVVGLGNIVFTSIPALAIMLILVGGLIAVSAKRPG